MKDILTLAAIITLIASLTFLAFGSPAGTEEMKPASEPCGDIRLSFAPSSYEKTGAYLTGAADKIGPYTDDNDESARYEEYWNVHPLVTAR